MKKCRTNKFSPRVFISKVTFRDIDITIEKIKKNMLENGFVSTSTTLWDSLSEMLVEELGEFALRIKIKTLKDN